MVSMLCTADNAACIQCRRCSLLLLLLLLAWLLLICLCSGGTVELIDAHSAPVNLLEVCGGTWTNPAWVFCVLQVQGLKDMPIKGFGVATSCMFACAYRHCVLAMCFMLLLLLLLLLLLRPPPILVVPWGTNCC
jgi:hypothetical protein